jgi:Ca-activated chloride channel family protein
MALRNLIILSLLFLPLSLRAENASDYIHRGAQKYIFGHEEAAEAEVKEGLAKFPNDRELREMLALFKKKPPQDQQNEDKDKNKNKDQNQQQQQQQQNSSGGQSKDQNNNQPTPSPSPDEKQDQNGPDQSSTPSPTPGSTPPDNANAGESPTPLPGSGDQSGNEKGEAPTPTPLGTPAKPLTGEVKGAGEQKPEGTPGSEVAEAEPEKEGEMTPNQAKALLESMKDEEEKVQLDEHKAARPVYKDW